ncbi:hypothetical protein [Pseudoalteromonas phage XCL1123]|nr:hypothetical protein [Pseudoalteromonas phage XCL1123]
MSSNNDTLTELHFKTFENYLAQQVEAYKQTSQSVSKLAESVNDLVLAEKIRTERDERVQEQIKTLQASIDKNMDGIRWASKMSMWIDSYIMKVAVPFVFTALIVLIVANTFDFSKLVGK